MPGGYLYGYKRYTKGYVYDTYQVTSITGSLSDSINTIYELMNEKQPISEKMLPMDSSLTFGTFRQNLEHNILLVDKLYGDIYKPGVSINIIVTMKGKSSVSGSVAVLRNGGERYIIRNTDGPNTTLPDGSKVYRTTIVASTLGDWEIINARDGSVKNMSITTYGQTVEFEIE